MKNSYSTITQGLVQILGVVFEEKINMTHKQIHPVDKKFCISATVFHPYL